jgi:hypothetical protein
MLIYHAGIMWGNVIVLSYGLMIHITCMVENETFFSYQDFEIFHIKGNTIEFKVTYLLQRTLLDMFLANSTIIVSIFLYLSFTAELTSALFFLSIVIMSHFLMPSYNYWAYKVGEQGVIASVIVLVIGLVGIIVGCINNIYPLVWLFSGSSIVNTFVLILLAVLYLFSLDFISKHYKIRPGAMINTRFFFKWLKPLNVFMFKDYVLFYKHVLFNLVMIFTLYSILIIGTEERLIPFIVAFIISSNSIFAVKKKKKYTLISEDPFFDESIIKTDIRTIRLTKLMTILSGSIIKIAICIGILFYHGIFEMMILSSLAVIMIVSAVIEFIVVYRNRLSSTIMSKFLVYTAVVIFGISSYFDSYYLLLWAYLLVLLLYCLFNTGNILRKEKSETTIRVNYTIANS